MNLSSLFAWEFVWLFELAELLAAELAAMAAATDALVVVMTWLEAGAFGFVDELTVCAPLLAPTCGELAFSNEVGDDEVGVVGAFWALEFCA